MAEPRARPRTKGQVFTDSDLRELLFSFGDTLTGALPTTTTVLDEILTDFIIETCHAAALCASYSRRQKIKAEDFRWGLRRNGAMLGRVNEVLFRQQWLKEQRRGIDYEGMAGAGKGGVENMEGLAEIGGVGEESRKKGKGRGRGRRKRKAEDESEAGDAQSAKKVKASP